MAVRVAIVGLGIMGRRMLTQMQAHPGFDPVALWDPSVAACDTAQALAPGVPVVTRAEDALATADLVYLACPPAARHSYALAAAGAGKAVFLEKPLGVDLAASEELVSGLRASGVPAAVNFTQAAGRALADISQAARSGAMGDLAGADIVVTYPAWPRAWQNSADWLRYRAEGGMTREVISHFLFFAERILGPLSVVHAHPTYPTDPALCETHMLARLETGAGMAVTVMASVGGAQPDRQELTIKGTRESHRVAEFFQHSVSDGGDFAPVEVSGTDPRADALSRQLDALLDCIDGRPNPLATPDEALRVQKLVEAMLAGV